MKNENESYLELNKLTFKNSIEKKYVQKSLNNVADRLRTMRLEKKLSQEELAELANVSVGTIKFIEQKQRSPSLAMLFKILYVLDKSVRILD